MKNILKLNAGKGFLDTAKVRPAHKTAVSETALEEPVIWLTDLELTPPRTVEEIKRAMAQGRFAEMTPDQAG